MERLTQFAQWLLKFRKNTLILATGIVISVIAGVYSFGKGAAEIWNYLKSEPPAQPELTLQSPEGANVGDRILVGVVVENQGGTARNCRAILRDKVDLDTYENAPYRQKIVYPSGLDEAIVRHHKAAMAKEKPDPREVQKEFDVPGKRHSEFMFAFDVIPKWAVPLTKNGELELKCDGYFSPWVPVRFPPINPLKHMFDFMDKKTPP
jgi:hypothetical protein